MNQHQNPQQTTAEECYHSTIIWWKGTSQEDAQDKVQKILADHKQPTAAQESPLVDTIKHLGGLVVSYLISEIEYQRISRKEVGKKRPRR